MAKTDKRSIDKQYTKHNIENGPFGLICISFLKKKSDLKKIFRNVIPVQKKTK